jgi:hypothetical protein
MDSKGDWFFEIYDSTHQMWQNHGPFEDEEQAEYAAMRYLQHE